MKLKRTTATVCAALFAALLPLQPATAGTRVEPCMWQNPGVPSSPPINLNEAFGVTAAFVSTECNEIKAGAPWTPTMGWYGAKTWEYRPVGVQTIGATPLDELRLRFVKIRLVVDAGTRKEFSVEWTNLSRLWVGEWNYFYGDHPDWFLANFVTLGSVRPLTAGTHTVQRAIFLSGVTCDGTSSDPNVSCAPAGEVDFPPLTFAVVR